MVVGEDMIRREQPIVAHTEEKEEEDEVLLVRKMRKRYKKR